MKRLKLLPLFFMLLLAKPAFSQGLINTPSDWIATQSAAATPCNSVGSPCGQIVEGGGPVEPLLLTPFSERAFRVYGGYEFGWLQPRFSNNVAILRPGPVRQFAKPFHHPYDLTSRVWLGVENSCCNGIRARYWNIDTQADNQVHFADAVVQPISMTIWGAGGSFSRTASALAGETLTANHRLQLHTIDLEGTHRMRVSCADLLASFGLRYADLHQRTQGVAIDGAGALTELVSQNLYFEGFGPTMSLELARGLCGNRSIWCGLSWFANTRWSLLIGQHKQDISYVNNRGLPAVNEVDDHKQDDFFPVGEFAGGLQYAAQPFGHGIWILRTGYRAESWWGTGGPTDADSNLGLHGVVFSIGALW